ncbi:MAG: GNAT family N-acetyltransferase [Chthonomonas sp.]|nr:GNAT family N-acetyltransferase [Chthonomonas sp.]
MLVRPAVVDDARAISEIQIETWRAAYRGIVADQTLDNLNIDAISATRLLQIEGVERQAFVAVHDGQVHGYTIAGPNPNPQDSGDFELRALYVRPSFQGQGIGRALISTAVQDQIGRGSRSMIIRAFEKNLAARRTYEDLGGKLIGSGIFELDGKGYPDVAYGFSDLPGLLDRLVPVKIREVNETDSISEITALLHRAYDRNTRAGLRFNACHQNDDRTLSRLSDGAGLIMLRNGRIVGTLALCLFEDLPYGTFHPEGRVASFGQFAIEPEFQAFGLGDLLIRRAEKIAKAAGADYLSLDTAQPAKGLITYYQQRGFEIVGEVDYRPGTNYISWVLAKRLA